MSIPVIPYTGIPVSVDTRIRLVYVKWLVMYWAHTISQSLLRLVATAKIWARKTSSWDISGRFKYRILHTIIKFHKHLENNIKCLLQRKLQENNKINKNQYLQLKQWIIHIFIGFSRHHVSTHSTHVFLKIQYRKNKKHLIIYGTKFYLSIISA